MEMEKSNSQYIIRKVPITLPKWTFDTNFLITRNTFTKEKKILI